MRPTVPVFLSLILLAGLLPVPAEADFIKCVKTGLTRCNCKSPYRIRCGNAEGQVQWNARLVRAGVVVKDDRGRVQDEFSLSISQLEDFNLDTIHEGGDAFREKLESMGKLPRGHSYEIRDFWLSDRLPMFNDTMMEDPKGTIAEVNRRMEPPDRCFYTKDPFAVDIGPDGYSTTVCIGEVQCRPRNGGNDYLNTAICLALDRSCPDASSCVADDTPLIHPFTPVPRSSR